MCLTQILCKKHCTSHNLRQEFTALIGGIVVFCACCCRHTACENSFPKCNKDWRRIPCDSSSVQCNNSFYSAWNLSKHTVLMIAVQVEYLCCCVLFRLDNNQIHVEGMRALANALNQNLRVTTLTYVISAAISLLFSVHLLPGWSALIHRRVLVDALVRVVRDTVFSTFCAITLLKVHIQHSVTCGWRTASGVFSCAVSLCVMCTFSEYCRLFLYALCAMCYMYIAQTPSLSDSVLLSMWFSKFVRRTCAGTPSLGDSLCDWCTFSKAHHQFSCS